MRTTFLVVNYAPSVGGAQSHVRRVAEGLAARHGHDVRVVTTDALTPPAGPDPGRVDRRHEVIGGVDVVRAPVARRVHGGFRTLRRVGRRVGVPPSAWPVATTVGPLGLELARSARTAATSSDAVVAVAVPFLTIAGVDWGTRGTGTARVVMPLLHLTGPGPTAGAIRALRRADGCSASTDHERQWLIDHGVDAARIELLPPGCDPERSPDTDATSARNELGLPDRPTVSYIGRMAAHKGIDTLVRAMPTVWADHPDTNLLIAGSDAGWDGLERELSSIRALAGDRLIVRGPFSEDAKPLLFAASDVVAFPSREESFGMVTLEAWCARRPVVAADIDSVRCVIAPGVDGELVPVGDADGLAGQIGKLLDDPGRRERYGRAGRARAEADFAWDGIVDRWDQFIRSSVDRRRAGGR